MVSFTKVVALERRVGQFVLDFTDLTTSGPTHSDTFGQLATDGQAALITDVFVELTTAFTGSAASDVDLNVGHGVGVDEYLAIVDVLSAPPTPPFVGITLAEKGAELDSRENAVVAVGEDINYRLAATGADVDTITAGRLTVNICYTLIPAAL